MVWMDLGLEQRSKAFYAMPYTLQQSLKLLLLFVVPPPSVQTASWLKQY